MEAVGSRLGRASSRYGAPAVFSGPVRKWKKKWVQVSSSLHNSSNNNNNSNSRSHSHSHKNNNNNNNSASSRLILRRWTPITAASAAEDDDDPRNVSDEPPRRKFRYTPIAALEEQKKAVTEKVEYEPAAESAQLPAGQTNLTYEIHGKLNMNEVSEESKLLQDSNIGLLDLGLSYPGNGENSQDSDDQSEKKYLVDSP